MVEVVGEEDSEGDVEDLGEAEGAMTRARQREWCLWGTSHTPVRRISSSRAPSKMFLISMHLCTSRTNNR